MLAHLAATGAGCWPPFRIVKEENTACALPCADWRAEARNIPTCGAVACDPGLEKMQASTRAPMAGREAASGEPAGAQAGRIC